MKENTNIWLNGIMGVVVGDALGCPVQFEYREEVARHPVTGMRGYGTFHLPEGSWTDDSSLTIALLESIRRVGKIDAIHAVGGLTHAHIRSNIACGLYFFMVKWILNGEGSLRDRLQKGLAQGFAFYESCLADKENLHYYDRLRDLTAFRSLPADKIRSTGYVADTLEAAVWALITTDSFDRALLKAVNLGDDTDTVGAIAGGLAGLYYGYDSIPDDWVSAIKRREWIEEMCEFR